MMSLFGASRAEKGTIAEVSSMVERYFKGRGLDPKHQEISGSEGCGWWLTEGSARVYVFVQDAPGGPVIRITSPLVTVPENAGVNFYRHLLDVNSTLTSCALATTDNVVLVVSQRAIAQLDQEELDSMVWNVAYVADLLDDKLVKQFGARRYQS
jgi:hypothetical protein